MRFLRTLRSLYDSSVQPLRRLVGSLFATVIAAPLLLLTATLVVHSTAVSRRMVHESQETVTRFASGAIARVFDYFVWGLSSFSSGSRVLDMPEAEQRRALRSLLFRENTIDELSLVGIDGVERARVSRLTSAETEPSRDWRNTEALEAAVQGRVRVGAFQVNPITRELVMEVSVPVSDVAEPHGMIVAKVRGRVLEQALVSLPLSESASVFVVNEENRVVVHANPSVVLRNKSYSPTIGTRVRPGLLGGLVVANASDTKIGGHRFVAVSERAVGDVYRPAVLISVPVVLVVVGVFLLVGRIRRKMMDAIVHPLEVLAAASASIGSENFSVSLPGAASPEHRLLGEALRDSNSRIRSYVQSLESSNRQKDTLLREVHHRVKNNLQVIRSMISLQSTDDPLLRATQDRILAMALVHDQLYASEDVTRVALSSYLRSLVVNTLAGTGAAVTPRIETENIVTSIDVAIPVGLIASELITNALRHAFPDGASGTVSVTLKRVGPRDTELRVADDGIGIDPAVATQDRPSTLGLTIVRSLVAQIDGTFELRPSDEGTTAVLCIPGVAEPV